jgi:hypothetical protein
VFVRFSPTRREEEPQVRLACRFRRPLATAGLHQSRQGIQEFFREARTLSALQAPGYHCTGKLGSGADWVSIPKLSGRINAVVHRTRLGRLKSITLTKTATGKYFASLLVDDGLNVPEPPLVIPQDAILLASMSA